jgi:glycosyltransferase involved in cell wall biosynthesis
MLSIIIPAHNEEQLIVTTLSCLLADEQLTRCQFYIVCNGCTDNTVTLIRSFIQTQNVCLKSRFIDIEIIETDIASKTNALNIGIKNLTTEQVVLLDADIKIQGSEVNELIAQLKQLKLLAVAPKVSFNYQRSSFFSRLYYRMSSQSFYNQYHRLSNVIALSNSGIERIKYLPDIIADDEFIRRRFDMSEYKIIDDVLFEFTCPKTIKSLLQVLTRVERGNLQLTKLNYHDNTGANLNGFVQKHVFSIPVFLFCKIFAKIRAKWQFNNGYIKQWERDESNR